MCVCVHTLDFDTCGICVFRNGLVIVSTCAHVCMRICYSVKTCRHFILCRHARIPVQTRCGYTRRAPLDTHSVRIPREVAPAAALADPHGVHPAVNGHFGRADKGAELPIRELVGEEGASLQEGGGDGVTADRHGYERDLLRGPGSGPVLLSSFAAGPIVLNECDHACSHISIFLLSVMVRFGVRRREERNAQILRIRRGCHVARSLSGHAGTLLPATSMIHTLSQRAVTCTKITRQSRAQHYVMPYMYVRGSNRFPRRNLGASYLLLLTSR